MNDVNQSSPNTAESTDKPVPAAPSRKVRFAAWFKKNAKVIATVSASVVLLVSLMKEFAEDARRDSEKIEAANNAFEHNLNIPASVELRQEAESMAGKRALTPAQELARLSVLNRNNQDI